MAEDFIFRSVVWRDPDGQLMVMFPHKGYASPIADPSGVYTTWPDENMDVVEVRVDADDELKFGMRSLFTLSWAQPPKGLKINSDSQMEEWPTKAAEVIDFAMQTKERAVEFMTLIHTDPVV